MKLLVLAASLALCSAQGFYGLVAHPNGAVVPVDEPAVAAAKAEHLATKGPVYAAAAPITAPAAPLGYAVSPLGYAAVFGYTGPLNLNTQLIAHPNGAVVPLDEPAVAAARADHLAAKGAVYAAQAPIVAAPLVPAAPFGYNASPVGYAAGYGYAGPLNLNTQLIAHPNGAVVPLDEPVVAAARADHLTAKGAVYAAAAPIADVPLAAAPLAAAPFTPGVPGVPASFSGYTGPLAGVPALVAHPNGAVVPVDEPAVIAARNDHLLSKGVIGGVYATNTPYAPYGGLVAHPNGAVVPVDEPVVAAARAEHLALLH